MKRTVSITLAVVCLLALSVACLRIFIVGNLSANSCVVDGVEWTYSVAHGRAEIGTLRKRAISSSTKGALVIPSELDGVPVTSIGRSAFRGCGGLTSVTIPSSVTNIGSSAFSGCRGLTTVAIPSSVTSIGDCAFEGCSDLTSVTIPSGVTSIGSSTFSGCSGLTSVTIPSSVTNIGRGAFSRCSGLTSVTIPSSVTKIGSRAFQECPLKKVLVAKGDEDRVKKLLKKSGGLDVSELKFGEMSEP